MLVRVLLLWLLLVGVAAAQIKGIEEEAVDKDAAVSEGISESTMGDSAVVTQTVENKVKVSYTVVDQDGYTYQNTREFDAAPTQKALDAAINADFTAWKVVMKTPVAAPTKDELQAQLVRAQEEKKVLESKIATLTASVAAAK